MNNEQNFLVVYGLHNFVSHARAAGKSAFLIRRQESRVMIDHAKSLIKGSFGETAAIQMV
jgi:hypothetical protein